MKLFSRGISLIETVICMTIISLFFILLISLNSAIKKFEEANENKRVIYKNYYNIIQIIKSDPLFYTHVEIYYNLNGEKVHTYETISNYNYINIYFDELGKICHQSKANYFIYITVKTNDYTDYINYYYNVEIQKSNVVSTTNGNSGVYFYATKKK